MKRLTMLGCLLAALLKPAHGENIILISIDTLRADRLSCYGYRYNKTPEIDRWAAEGIRFERAFSEYPLTLPSHSTLLTGTYPLYHGVRENVGFSLANEYVTLAEILKGNGYATAGFIGSYVLASQFGIAQGFETYDEDFGAPLEKIVAATALRRPAQQVTDRFLAWLSAQGSDKFFAFVHFYDPHAPCPDGYDSEVSRVDRSIGRIDAFLKKRQLLDKTHVFLLSDHGEALGDHGESGHGFFLYDSTLRVPLIVRPAASFSFSQKRVEQAVTLADVMPTILQMAGLQGPTYLQGRSLVRKMLGKDAADGGVYAETFISQLQFGWSPLRSYRLGRYKLIDAPRPELYDLVTDPGEKVNIFSQNRALANQYRVQLDGFASRNQSRDGGPGAARPVLEASEKLAALGYVTLGTMKVRSDFGQGIDPKDRIAVFEKYHAALNDIAGGNISNRIFDRIDEIRKQAPELRQLVFLEARASETLGRPEDAYAKFRQGLEEEPENNVARAQMAGLLIRLARYDEAQRELEQVLEGDPEDYRSRNNLAGIYRMKGRVDAAVAQLQRALATRPSYAAGWQNLGQLYVQMRNWKEAEAAFRKAVRFDPKSAPAHFLLAQVLKATGKSAEAERCMRIALQLDPSLARRPQ